MKILVYGAGVLGSIAAAELHQAGHDVSLLARGGRLADLRQYGLVLVDDQSGAERVVHVNLVESLSPDDVYDLVLVNLRKNQIDSVLPVLAANHHTPTIAFLGNNAAGPDAYIKSLGRERVLMGFLGAGGERDGHIVRHIRASAEKPASLYIGELDGSITPRLQAIQAAFQGTHVNVLLSPNIDAWLKTHIAFVSPAAAAMYLAGGSNYRLAHTRDGVVLMIRAVREGFAALRALSIPVTPRSLGLIFRLPEPLLVLLFGRLLNTRLAEIAMARHANAAVDEMTAIAAEFRALIAESGLSTPNWDRLWVYFDRSVPPMPEGSRTLSLNWTGILGSAVAAALFTLPILRRVHPKRRHA